MLYYTLNKFYHAEVVTSYNYSYHGFLSWYLTSEEDEQTVEHSSDMCSIRTNFDDIWWYEIHDIVHKNRAFWYLSVRSVPASRQTNYPSEKALVRREVQGLNDGEVKVFWFIF